MNPSEPMNIPTVELSNVEPAAKTTDPSLSAFHIVHVTTVHIPQDVRIFHKECRSLAEAGFKVTIVCCNDSDEIVHGVRLKGIPKPAGRFQRITKTQWQAFRAALREKGDLYHLHDPELMPLGLALRACGKRVVYDVHEDNRLKVWEKTYLSYPLRVALSWIVGRIEDFCGWAYNGIVTVTPHIARYFPKRKTVLVRNYPEYGEFELKDPPPYATRPNNVTYIGSITANRGAWRMVQAVHGLNSVPQATLVLAGLFGTQQLEDELKASPEWDRVKFLGFLSRKGIGEALSQSRVGLLVLDPTPCYLDSYPMKLFEYMAAGIPVVASDFPLWREIVEEAKCGLLVDGMNVKAVTEAIRYLLEHPQEAEEMGKRGREAARRIYTWEQEAETLISLYERILAR